MPIVPIMIKNSVFKGKILLFESQKQFSSSAIKQNACCKQSTN